MMRSQIVEWQIQVITHEWSWGLDTGLFFIFRHNTNTGYQKRDGMQWPMVGDTDRITDAIEAKCQLRLSSKIEHLPFQQHKSSETTLYREPQTSSEILCRDTYSRVIQPLQRGSSRSSRTCARSEVCTSCTRDAHICWSREFRLYFISIDGLGVD